MTNLVMEMPTICEDNELIEQIKERIEQYPQNSYLSTLHALYYISPLGYLFNRDKHNLTLAVIKEVFNKEMRK